MSGVQNLAEVCSDHGLRTLTVNVQNSLAEIGCSELCCAGVKLGAHLLNGSSVATNDEHVLPDEHDHAALASSKRGERLLIQYVQVGCRLPVRQSSRQVILQVILQPRLFHFG